MERYFQNRILKPPLHHKSFAYALQNVQNLHFIFSARDTSSAVQGAVHRGRDWFVANQVDYRMQNTNILQTMWNTNYKTIANYLEYKIQNYCKLGRIQNTKWKLVANVVEYKMQTKKLLQSRWNTKCKIRNYFKIRWNTKCETIAK